MGMLAFRTLAAATAAAAAAATVTMTDADGHALPAGVVAADGASVSVSGISSGADFAVQLQVAYSEMFAGVGVFAG